MWHIHNVTFDVDNCNIHHGLSHILMFIMVMLHSDIYYGLFRTLLFIKGYIALWHPSMVHSLMALSHSNIHWCLRRISTSTIVHSLMVFMHRDIHRELCWILTFIKEYTIVHSLMVFLHCVIHQELCWISTFIKEYIG